MDTERYVDVTEREAARFLALASADGADLSKPVPSCPDWDFEALLEHVSRVWNWAGTIVADQLRDGPPKELEQRPDDMSLADWASNRLTRNVSALRATPGDVTLWAFRPGNGNVDFWRRRQMHEIVIHRVDAELTAADYVTAFEPELAADNVSELFELKGFQIVDELPEPSPTENDGPRTIHLHATDVPEAEWTLDRGSRTLTTEHAKGDVAIRGTAWGIARWLWGRPADGDVELHGDADAAESWRRSFAP